jgi:hypothetical protein
MTTPDSAHTQGQRPERFGRDVHAIARLLAEAETGGIDTFTLLTEIDRRWPGLPFRDFLGAHVLAVALGMETRGNA